MSLGGKIPFLTDVIMMVLRCYYYLCLISVESDDSSVILVSQSGRVMKTIAKLCMPCLLTGESLEVVNLDLCAKTETGKTKILSFFEHRSIQLLPADPCYADRFIKSKPLRIASDWKGFVICDKLH